MVFCVLHCSYPHKINKLKTANYSRDYCLSIKCLLHAHVSQLLVLGWQNVLSCEPTEGRLSLRKFFTEAAPGGLQPDPACFLSCVCFLLLLGMESPTFSTCSNASPSRLRNNFLNCKPNKLSSLCCYCWVFGQSDEKQVTDRPEIQSPLHMSLNFKPLWSIGNVELQDLLGQKNVWLVLQLYLEG